MTDTPHRNAGRESITRRTFLRTKGAAMALPFLPSLTGAATPKPDKKLVMMYVPNGVVRRGFFPGEETAELPGFIGGFNADKVKNQRRIENEPGIYPLELTSTMQPMATHTRDITLITGLDRTFKNGQDVHAQGASCYLTSVSPDQAQEKGWRYPNGRSLDQVIADAVGHKTIFKSLEISCNGFKPGKESIYFNNISWYGPDRIAPSITDPKKLYDRLFMAGSYRSHISEVTSLMLADAKSLSHKLNHGDRETLDVFMTIVRDIEVRIEKLSQLAARSEVKEPGDAALPRGLYIQTMTDLMVSALQMGITNICTFMVGPERWDAVLTYEGVFDKPVQHHNMTHNQKGDGWKNVQKIDIFHMQQYAYMLDRMKQIKEADGSSLLDNAMVTYGAGLGDGAAISFSTCR